MPRAQRALDHEVRDRLRRIRECHGRGFEEHQAALLQQLPGHHDVLADGIRPAADGLDTLGAVDGEGALGHERRLVQALHALHSGDAEVVVPLLHAGEQVGARVAHEHRAGHGDGICGRGFEPGDQAAQGFAVQQRVGVDGDHVRGHHLLERGVQRVRLAGGAFGDHPQIHVGFCGGPPGEPGGGIVGTVVGQDHGDLAGVVTLADAPDRVEDARLLVARGHDDGQGRHGVVDPERRLAVQQERHGH
jgi:hypothetical protein